MQLNNKNIVRTALFAVLVGGALGYSFAAKSETKLLPFQGKLTDANGQVVEDKAIVVQFKMYDAPVGGQAKWNGEVQMLSVNGGLVNTTLGTKASLKNVDFSSPTYLEITIDANGDNQIGPEDPPLLPRQSIIPAVYAVKAGDAKTLSGYDWSAIFGSNDPTGKIPGNKLADGSITGTQIASKTITAQQIKDSTITSAKLASGAVTSSQLAKNSVTTDKLASGSVTSEQLAKDSVTTDKIAEKSITTELMGERAMVDASETAAPVGSIACSKGIEDFYVSSIAPDYKEVPGLSLKLKTSGRPVMLMLKSLWNYNNGWIESQGGAQILLKREDSYTADMITADMIRLTTGTRAEMPPSTVSFIDTPPAGEHYYKIYCGKFSNNTTYHYKNLKLIAFEL